MREKRKLSEITVGVRNSATLLRASCHRRCYGSARSPFRRRPYLEH